MLFRSHRLEHHFLLLHILQHLKHHESVEQYFLRSYYDIALLFYSCGEQIKFEQLNKINREHFQIPETEENFRLINQQFGVTVPEEDKQQFDKTNTFTFLLDKKPVDKPQVDPWNYQMNRISHFNNTKDKAIYLYHTFFPSKEFMRYQYPVNIHENLLFLLYFYRMYLFILRSLKKLLQKNSIIIT